ncbi:MAG: hypothetical protein NUV57_02295 [archaeon]|nr:hypothetical protein [archaeon]
MATNAWLAEKRARQELVRNAGHPIQLKMVSSIHPELLKNITRKYRVPETYARGFELPTQLIKEKKRLVEIINASNKQISANFKRRDIIADAKDDIKDAQARLGWVNAVLEQIGFRSE